MDLLGFGGGCHWCSEAVFQSLYGVQEVEQGFIYSDPPNDAFSEAVIVTYDPTIISFTQLIDIHLRTHSSTVEHSLREKYRSAIYTFNEGQSVAVQNTLKALQGDFDKPLITQVLPFRGFKLSDDKYQNYYHSNPKRPFCRTFIDPKLTKLRNLLGKDLMKNETK